MNVEEKAAMFLIIQHEPQTPELFTQRMMQFDERALTLPVHRYGNTCRVFYHIGQDDKQINATWDEWEAALRRFSK